MISKAFFLVSFSWSIIRGLKDASLTLLFSLNARSVKPVIEMAVPVLERPRYRKNWVHLTEYLKQKKEQDVLIMENYGGREKVQELLIPTLDRPFHSVFFLN